MTAAWDRSTRLQALGWSLPDVTPAPAGARFADGGRGVAPTAWRVCSCDAGVVRDRFKRETTCGLCGGAGRVKVDGYTLDQVSTATTPAPVRVRRVLCDRCGGEGFWKHARCQQCSGSGELSIPDFRVPPALSRARFVDAPSEIIRLREQGSYDELEHVLAQVRVVQPAAFRTWLQVRVYGTTTEAEAGGWLRAGDRLVSALMPRKVLVPSSIRYAWLTVQDGRTRNERIRSLARRGTGSSAIATATGCSVRTVQRVLFTRRAA